MKMFTVAGTSLLDGQVTYRFANNLNRAAVLKANGHTDIKLFQLPYAMSKEVATEWLSSTHEIVIVATESESDDAPRNTDTSYKPYVPYNSGDEYKPDVAAANFIRMWWNKAEDGSIDTPTTDAVEQVNEVETREARQIAYAAKRAAIKRAQRAQAKAAKELA